MEVENQVFGKGAGTVGNIENLESEDFEFYCQNKEEAKNNIDNSSKDLTDFIGSLIQDVPAPSEKEVKAGIEKILAETHPEEKNETVKSDKKKRVTLKVLFVAALLSLLSVSGLFVVGNSYDVSIENGFVTFAKDTIKIVFFGDEGQDYITVDALLADLALHGYDDIMFPQEFVTKSDEYKVSVPNYFDDELNQVGFDIYSEDTLFSFGIYEYNQSQKSRDFENMINADSIQVNGTYVYLFEFDTGITSVEFTCGDYFIYIHSYDVPYSDLTAIAKTLK